MKLHCVSSGANHWARKVIDNNIALVLKSHKFCVFLIFTGKFGFLRFCYCKKQIDVSFLCVCPLTDDKITQQLCVDPHNTLTMLWRHSIIKKRTDKKLASICTGNVGKGWFQPRQSGLQQLSHNSQVKLWFSIKLIATELFSTPFNCWMAI